jgi:hypothetical protein
MDWVEFGAIAVELLDAHDIAERRVGGADPLCLRRALATSLATSLPVRPDRYDRLPARTAAG